MTPEQIDRVFGRSRLRMVTGDHVEVFREAARAGDRRRYTKRFLNTVDADFGHWTEREWRILARLIGHGIDCVPEVVQFDRGEPGGTQLVQTYDAGATVDQWATLLPVSRESRMLRHVFEDCAHWWALAHHCLRALSAIHALSVVHLDIKGDNVCIPVGPPGFDPDRAGLRLYPRFAELALIDFAFALVSRESLHTALPIGWQTDYDYQSPRLLSALEAGRRGNLKPTRELDWRCDMYSLAAMLKRYLPDEDAVMESGLAYGWSLSRAGAAKDLILALRDAHDREALPRRPHEELMQLTNERLAEPDLSASLAFGWTLARDANITPVAASPMTPLTRLAPSIRVIVAPRERETITVPPTVIRRRTRLEQPAPGAQEGPPRKRHAAKLVVFAMLVVAGIVAVAAPFIDARWPAIRNAVRSATERAGPAADMQTSQRAAESPQPQVAESAPAQSTLPDGADATPSPLPSIASQPSARAVPPAAAARGVAPARSPRVPTESSRKTALAESKPLVAPSPRTKPSAVRVGSAPSAPAQARIRFHVPDVVPTATTPPPSVPVQVASAAPAAEKLPQVVPPAQQSLPVAPPSSDSRKATPTPSPTPGATGAASLSPIEQDVRHALSFLIGLARRGERAVAPIEDRASQLAAVPAPRAPNIESERASAAAQRPEPLRVIPEPVLVPDAAVAPVPGTSAPREPAPRTMSPSEVSARNANAAGSTSFARAEQEIARVLWLAANTSDPAQDPTIIDALRRPWPSNAHTSTPTAAASSAARQLSEDARQAFLVRRDVQVALDLQRRAFAANPHDAEIAGTLAFLYLQVSPSQAENARQFVMHAIGVTPASLRPAQVDHWHTLAVASALAGREFEATHALYVVLVLSRDLDRSCKLVRAAVDSYGDRLVAPVQAMMLRLRHRGREHESHNCTWPPRWQASRRPF